MGTSAMIFIILNDNLYLVMNAQKFNMAGIKIGVFVKRLPESDQSGF